MTMMRAAMVIVAFSLVRVRIGVRVGWAEQQAFAEIHEAHELSLIHI